ncbi:MAG: 23S rRNA (guanosine(2251)-2'-O)-methyltransferase RlmB [Cyanobacteria bacterium REEB65]|nr:23S rRNA (guanosine(2251)-2'-O)-methyltransferase RlmB [Cyanobacteria bacterium REEB65]
MPEERDLLWGRHAVLEALKGDRPVNKVWMLRGLEDARTASNVRRLAREKGAVVIEVERNKLDAMAAGPHQGLVAALAAAAYVDLDELVGKAFASPGPLLLALDGIEDPHNLGALVRTAGAAGAHGVVIPQRRAAGLTGVVAKAAAGALEHVPVARVSNIVRALQQLQKAGFWIVGADERADKMAYEVDLTGPVVLVIGAEGAGLSRLVRESCDTLVRFPMQGKVPSLNASVAGGLLLFEAVRQRAQEA